MTVCREIPLLELGISFKHILKHAWKSIFVSQRTQLYGKGPRNYPTREKTETPSSLRKANLG